MFRHLKKNLSAESGNFPSLKGEGKYKPHEIYLKYITNSDFKLKGDQL